jgi:hypothetical protein
VVKYINESNDSVNQQYSYYKTHDLEFRSYLAVLIHVILTTDNRLRMLRGWQNCP